MIEDFTKSEFQQRQWTIVLDIQKVPLQGFLQCSRRVCHGDSIVSLRFIPKSDCAKGVENMAIRCGIIIPVLFSLCISLPAVSANYEVGVGKTFANIGDVPWESMNAGDQVLIHWRQQPYKEKWVIAVQGTEQQPFVVRGVPNQYGEWPVIDGRDATTRSQINFWNENRGVVKIGGANSPAVDTPAWIVLENLVIRSGRTPYQFTGRGGITGYSSNAASIFVEAGQNVTLRNCVLHDSGNGLFVSHASRNVLVEGCWIYDNGIEGSIY